MLDIETLVIKIDLIDEVPYGTPTMARALLSDDCYDSYSNQGI